VKLSLYLVDVLVDQGHVVVAGNAVSEGRKPFLYPLDDYLVREAVPYVHHLYERKE